MHVLRLPDISGKAGPTRTSPMFLAADIAAEKVAGGSRAKLGLSFLTRRETSVLGPQSSPKILMYSVYGTCHRLTDDYNSALYRILQ
jgi:hypothetical protein